MIKTLLILGNDKIAGSALTKINNIDKDTKIIIDRSTNFKRIKRLIQKKILKPSLIFKMALNEIAHPIQIY